MVDSKMDKPGTFVYYTHVHNISIISVTLTKHSIRIPNRLQYHSYGVVNWLKQVTTL